MAIGNAEQRRNLGAKHELRTPHYQATSMRLDESCHSTVTRLNGDQNISTFFHAGTQFSQYLPRVDHVSDVGKLELNDPEIPLCWSSQVCDLDKSADDWRLEGNDEYKRLNYWKAIQEYISLLYTNKLLADR